MIAVEEALSKILKETTRLQFSERLPLQQVFGRVLFSDIISPINLPPFDQSAVDGYALSLKGDNAAGWTVRSEMKAGDFSETRMQAGEAVRIFTGAMVPAGADTVVMQEHVTTGENGQIYCETASADLNIRPEGSQIKSGALALKAGSTVNAASIGFLASMGITHVDVVARPRVGIIVTGDELAKPGDALPAGGIYESNSVMLQSALFNLGLTDLEMESVKDNQADLEVKIQNLVDNNQVLLLTGGISVGKYDFVKAALLNLGATEIFYKVAQKPGKPLFFAKLKDTLVFALPGNPAAVLTCFYEYVLPALSVLLGKSNSPLVKVKVPAAGNYKKKAGLVNFLKGRIEDGKVQILEGQESYILKSFSEANCLIYLAADSEGITIGDMVEVHMLPILT